MGEASKVEDSQSTDVKAEGPSGEDKAKKIKGGSKEELVDAAQLAAEAQPTGTTFETTAVTTKVVNGFGKISTPL